MTQDEIFLKNEGDHWFARNRAFLDSVESLIDDPVIRVLSLTKLVPQKVLEVGASNGYRLQEIHRRFHCPVTAVEPSAEAIRNGQAGHPAVRFLRGTAAQLSGLEAAEFDLVIVHFVFHWIDRACLLRSAAELDRVLQDGGYLMIGDFLPARPQRVNYHHLPGQGVWTYKQNYAEVFLGTNLYDLIACIPFLHGTGELRHDAASTERSQIFLLRKRLQAGYETVENLGKVP